MIILGIDSGITGAIGAVDLFGKYVGVHDMPVMARGKGQSKVKNQVNPSELADLLNKMLSRGHVMAYLERVSSMPGQGVASMFSMGDSFGAIRGVLAALDVPVGIITPQQWKKYYGLGRDKEICRAKAIEIFPEASLGRKKDHNRAEALLIANYGLHNLERN